MHKPNSKWHSSNKSCSVEIGQQGGCFTSFKLNEVKINPLTFKMERPESSSQDAEKKLFMGHFLCAGSWGDLSPGETAHSAIKHSDISAIEWHCMEGPKLILKIAPSSKLEALSVERQVRLDNEGPYLLVKETFSNLGNFSRLFNIDQHPTIASPYLNNLTIIECNATNGFRNLEKDLNNPSQSYWANSITAKGQKVDINSPQQPCTGVYSFVVDKESKLGWTSAYSPEHNCVPAYVWQRKAYPCINMWIHVENNQIKYRGLEFGTTCMHISYKEIFKNHLWQFLEEKTCLFLDAGEQITYEYISYFIPVSPAFKGVKEIRPITTGFELIEKTTGSPIFIHSSLKID